MAGAKPEMVVYCEAYVILICGVSGELGSGAHNLPNNS